MDTQFDASVEDTVVGAYRQLVDVYSELVGEDVGHVAKKTLPIDAAYFDYSVEEELLVHTPPCVDKAVAIAGLKL